MDSTLTNRILDRASLILAAIIGTIYLAIACVAAARWYSPVPFWDMWDGYLNFYVRTLDGDYTAWWQRHNDHRILLERLLFWIDLRYLKGSLWLLIIANYLLAIAIWGVFDRIARSELRSPEHVMLRRTFSLAALAISLSWIQRDNFTWGFQNVMFMANLLPITSFYFLGRSVSHNTAASRILFLASLAAGALAAFTMINGLATLPMLAALALALRQSPRRIIAIIALALTVIAVYSFDTASSGGVSPSSGGSALHALITAPFAVIAFFLVNIGAPFHYILELGTGPSLIGGGFVVLTTFILTYSSVRATSHRTTTYVLIAFLVYGLLTSFGTALSRVETWGIDYAFSSRYMTTVAAVWISILLLVVLRFERYPHFRRLGCIVLIVVPIALLPLQLRAVHPDHESLITRSTAALALELGVRDEEEIARLAGDVDRTIELAREPIRRNLSVFGNLTFRDAREAMGTHVERHGVECAGDIEERILLPNERKFVRVTGWMIDEFSGQYPSASYILDEHRDVVGYVVSGAPRIGLAEKFPYSKAGFVGYINSIALNNDIYIRGRDISCEIKIPHTSTLSLSPASFTDQNWIGGVAREWGPAFFVRLHPDLQQKVSVGTKVRFADKSVRSITSVEIKQDDAIIHVDGGFLDGAIVGFPRKIELLDP